VAAAQRKPASSLATATVATFPALPPLAQALAEAVQAVLGASGDLQDVVWLAPLAVAKRGADPWRAIVCPCHGGEYNAETGEVIAGPPPSPLAPKKVLEVGGEIYAVPS